MRGAGLAATAVWRARKHKARGAFNRHANHGLFDQVDMRLGKAKVNALVLYGVFGVSTVGLAHSAYDTRRVLDAIIGQGGCGRGKL